MAASGSLRLPPCYPPYVETGTAGEADDANTTATTTANRYHSEAFTVTILFNNSRGANASILTSYVTHVDENPSTEDTNYDWFQVAIPIVTVFGIVGNSLNLMVLTRQRLIAGLDRLGRTANHGLIALAVSDLMFCLTVVPHAFITNNSHIGGASPYPLYYQLYGIASINLFSMVSTWLIVTMALKRYVVVVYPLHARDHLTARRTIFALTMVYVTSLAFTLPYYLHVQVRPCLRYDNSVAFIFKQYFSHDVTVGLRFYIRWVWPIVADFVPIAILIFCNCRLVRELRRATSTRRSSCPGQHVKETSHRVTLTLVIIVLMLLILVSPSEILKYINPYRVWGKAGVIVASVTNLLQTVNFSSNFLLYFAVNAKFRQTLRAMVSALRPCAPSKSDDTDRRSSGTGTLRTFTRASSRAYSQSVETTV